MSRTVAGSELEDYELVLVEIPLDIDPSSQKFLADIYKLNSCRVSLFDALALKLREVANTLRDVSEIVLTLYKREEGEKNTLIAQVGGERKNVCIIVPKLLSLQICDLTYNGLDLKEKIPLNDCNKKIVLIPARYREQFEEGASRDPKVIRIVPIDLYILSKGDLDIIKEIKNEDIYLTYSARRIPQYKALIEKEKYSLSELYIGIDSSDKSLSDDMLKKIIEKEVEVLINAGTNIKADIKGRIVNKIKTLFNIKPKSLVEIILDKPEARFETFLGTSYREIYSEGRTIEKFEALVTLPHLVRDAYLSIAGTSKESLELIEELEERTRELSSINTGEGNIIYVSPAPRIGLALRRTGSDTLNKEDLNFLFLRV